MKKSDKQFRRFDLEYSYYYAVHDEDKNLISDMSESEWREKMTKYFNSLSEGDKFLEVVFAFHDSDINEDGTEKGLHVHAVVTPKDPMSQNAAFKFFNTSSKWNCQPCDSYVDSMRYLIHVAESAIEAMKTIYLPDIVQGWYKDIDGNVNPMTVRAFQERMRRKKGKKARHEQKKVRDTCVSSIMNGSAISSDVRDIYVDDTYNVGLSPVDYLSDKRIIQAAAAEWLERITEFYQSHQCPKTTVYIYGKGGTGKTTLATAFANSVADIHGIHEVSSKGESTTFDFAGTYKGQRVSVFNELSASFPVEQFLSVFDTLRAVPVSSRHVDKLYFANYVLLTTSVPLENFIYNLWRPYAKKTALIPVNVRSSLLSNGADEATWLKAYLKYIPSGDDKILQIRRRIAVRVIIGDDKTATISVLDCKHNSSDCFAFSQNYQDPYVDFSKFPYDVTDAQNYEHQRDAVVKSMHRAIDYYYELNGFKKPDEYEKPDFKNEKEK